MSDHSTKAGGHIKCSICGDFKERDFDDHVCNVDRPAPTNTAVDPRDSEALNYARTRFYDPRQGHSFEWTVMDFKAGWDARDEEVRRLRKLINDQEELHGTELDALRDSVAENKRLREALDAFQEGVNPEDMTPRQREAMRNVSLKAGVE